MIKTLPSKAGRLEVSIDEIPAGVRSEILTVSPLTTTAIIDGFTLNDKPYLGYAAAKGSRDGFPYVTKKVTQ